jgi:hypothetical protein
VSDEKADRIRKKISASQARSRGEGTARKANPKAEAKPRTPRRKDDRSLFDKALDDHPLALLAGSVVLGAIAASLLPASWGRKLGRRALGLAAVAGELGAAYGHKAWDAASDGARAGQEKLGDLGETLSDTGAGARRKAVELGALAGKRAVELAEQAARTAREASGSAAKAIGDLSERVRH